MVSLSGNVSILFVGYTNKYSSNVRLEGISTYHFLSTCKSSRICVIHCVYNPFFYSYFYKLMVKMFLCARPVQTITGY